MHTQCCLFFYWPKVKMAEQQPFWRPFCSDIYLSCLMHTKCFIFVFLRSKVKMAEQQPFWRLFCSYIYLSCLSVFFINNYHVCWNRHQEVVQKINLLIILVNLLDRKLHRVLPEWSLPLQQDQQNWIQERLVERILR
jgi:hypothetical protein